MPLLARLQKQGYGKSFHLSGDPDTLLRLGAAIGRQMVARALDLPAAEFDASDEIDGLLNLLGRDPSATSDAAYELRRRMGEEIDKALLFTSVLEATSQ